MYVYYVGSQYDNVSVRYLI